MSIQIFLRIISFIPLLILAVALVLNTTAFLVFRLSKRMKKNSSMMYLSYIVLLDIAALFTWNLNHFLFPNFHILIQFVNVHTCRFFTFLQYFSLHSIGILYTFISIDRLVIVYTKPGSVWKKLPFSTVKSAFWWSMLITVLMAILNAHILLSDQIMHQNSTVQPSHNFECFSDLFWYDFYLIWSHLSFGLYFVLPNSIIFICNSFIFRRLFKSGSTTYAQTSTTSNANRISFVSTKKQQITISLLVITFLSVVMKAPSCIYFLFFYTESSMNEKQVVIVLVDIFFFASNASVFLSSWFTYPRFQKLVKEMAFRAARRIIRMN